MILPIYAYGQPVLRRKAEEVDPDYPELQQLISNMWETMYHARGVGLAAPQIGRSIRLFIVDTEQMEEEDDPFKGIRKVFLNARIVEQSGDLWDYEEGCLSIPHVRGDVERQARIVIRYMDASFTEHEDTFDDLNARVIQHEYDHINGILFTEHLKPLKKRLVQRKLEQIRKGKVKSDYVLKFAKKK